MSRRRKPHLVEPPRTQFNPAARGPRCRLVQLYSDGTYRYRDGRFVVGGGMLLEYWRDLPSQPWLGIRSAKEAEQHEEAARAQVTRAVQGQNPDRSW